jgi:hypothetical protein
MEETASEKNSETIRLWRVYKTSRQMLQDRVCEPPWLLLSNTHSLSQGYQILDDEVNITLDEFIETFADADGVTEYGPQNCSH